MPKKVVLTISPKKVTLAPGETQQFTVVSDPPGSPVSWSCGGKLGTLSGSGLYTAGTKVGADEITARANDGETEVTADVTIQAKKD